MRISYHPRKATCYFNSNSRQDLRVLNTIMCEMLHKLIILHLYPDGNDNSRMSFYWLSKEKIKSLEVAMQHLLSLY